MPDLFSTLMNRQMGSQETPPGTPAPPSAAVGMWSGYQAPPLNRPPGWTTGPKSQPNQQTQAIGPGPGSATPPPSSSVVPGGAPMPPNPPGHVAPQAERFANSQMMQEGYKNGWNPNPVLLKAMLNRG